MIKKIRPADQAALLYFLLFNLSEAQHDELQENLCQQKLIELGFPSDPVFDTDGEPVIDWASFDAPDLKGKPYDQFFKEIPHNNFIGELRQPIDTLMTELIHGQIMDIDQLHLRMDWAFRESFLNPAILRGRDLIRERDFMTMYNITNRFPEVIFSDFDEELSTAIKNAFSDEAWRLEVNTQGNLIHGFLHGAYMSDTDFTSTIMKELSEHDIDPIEYSMRMITDSNGYTHFYLRLITIQP